MISKIAIAAAAIIALGVGGFFLFRPPVLPAPSDTEKEAPPQGAWIEVIAPPVSERGADGALIRTLASGDALVPGTTIASGAGAKAVIHFPDGSVARLDEKSRITLAEEKYDAKNKTHLVRIRLAAGRVWSKVMSLATPESLWEVKTANTVVAVRGTAFGVEFEDGQSRVISAENAVEIIIVDPATGDAIPGAKDRLEENHIVTIRNDAIAAIKRRPETVGELIRITPEAVRREGWIEDAIREDQKIEQKQNGESRAADTTPEDAIKQEPTSDIRTNAGPARNTEAPLAPSAPSDTSAESAQTQTITSTPTASRLVIEMTGGVRTLAQGVLYLAAVVILFERGMAINIIHTQAAWILSGTALFLYRHLSGEREKRRIKNIFSKYVSLDVLREILRDPAAVRLGGEEREITLLFSDIRGFTSISEKTPPTELVRILNRYFSVMTEEVLHNGGVLDKYIGDAIMAFWGAPVSDHEQAEKAVRTALAMIEKLVVLNREFAAAGDPEIAIGVGVYTGRAVVGNVGSHLRFDYTAIGDTVNAASRIEGLTKQYRTPILIGDTTRNKLKDPSLWKFVDEAAVKGKQDKIKIYGVRNC